MQTEASPQISSFIIRFVHSMQESESSPRWVGFVRHIQSDEEFAFTDWEQARSFMTRFVPLGDEPNATIRPQGVE